MPPTYPYFTNLILLHEKAKIKNKNWIKQNYINFLKYLLTLKKQEVIMYLKNKEGKRYYLDKKDGTFKIVRMSRKLTNVSGRV